MTESSSEGRVARAATSRPCHSHPRKGEDVNIETGPLTKAAYELCQAIEKCEASEACTNAAVLASALGDKIEALEKLFSSADLWRHLVDTKDAEFFEDGLSADLAELNINTIEEAYVQGFKDCLQQWEEVMPPKDEESAPTEEGRAP